MKLLDGLMWIIHDFVEVVLDVAIDLCEPEILALIAMNAIVGAAIGACAMVLYLGLFG